MRALGLDLGTKTLGISISDKNGIIASPYRLIRYSNLDELVNLVVDIINKEEIEIIALGLPKNMNNSMGFAADRSLNFKDKLEQKTKVKIELIDERLSTVEAENILISADVSRTKRKNVIDVMAACIILDTYLGRSKNGK